MVGSYQSQAEHLGRGGQKAISRVLVRERQFLRRYDYFVSQRRFAHIGRRTCDPILSIAVQLYSTFGLEQERFPRAHRRKP